MNLLHGEITAQVFGERLVVTLASILSPFGEKLRHYMKSIIFLSVLGNRYEWYVAYHDQISLRTYYNAQKMKIHFDVNNINSK